MTQRMGLARVRGLTLEDWMYLRREGRVSGFAREMRWMDTIAMVG